MALRRFRSACARKLRAAAWTLGALLLLLPVLAQPQETQRLSLATGGPGGVYQPLGSGMADLLDRYLPGLDVAAEPTQGSEENLKLLGAGKADFGFCRVDSAWQAAHAVPLRNARSEPRTLLMLYPNRMQLVTVERTGISRFADLKGKRVSTGAAGGAIEVMALRALEAAGVDPKADIEQMQLALAESIAALTDGRIDAFFWVGEVPTPAIARWAVTSGMKAKLIDLGEVREAMNREYGPLYTKGVIVPDAYAGVRQPVENIDVWNILVTTDRMSDQMAYDIVKTLIERQPELAAAYAEARNIDLRYQSVGSPIPYHPGARKYFEERGVRF
jgi:TRAP transporter TAXI family solute receptor